MTTLSLLKTAQSIAQSFLSILQEDASLDKRHASNKSGIEAKYKEKIAELASARSQRISAASAQNQTALKNIQDALNALDEADASVPARYRKNRRPANPSPRMPDFQALEEIAMKISDGSFYGRVRRLTGTGGYSSMAEMVRDYLDSIEAGRLYLLGEQQKSARYLAQETSGADAEYARMKALADQRKAGLAAQNDQAHHQAGVALQNRLFSIINGPGLPQYEASLTEYLRQLGALEEGWSRYEPRFSYPDQLMLGTVLVPLAIPSPADRMIQEKMPVAFRSGRGFCVPMAVTMSQPLLLSVCYDDRCKSKVMEGIQSILLKWIRFLPPYSFCITYIDPNDRGSNLGLLQKLEEIAAWDLCRRVYASREDITRRLKELEKFVDATCSRLAGVGSAYDYNKSREPVILQHLVVINDFPEKMDRAAEESLDVLINNAVKCGISMIFTKKGSLSELPHAVQHAFLRIQASAEGNTIPFQNKSLDFQFDSVCPSCDAFLEGVKKVYLEGFQVDNRFGNYFADAGFHGYRESTQSLLIPFAVDSRKRLVELELGGALTAHALLSGSTGSGKSTTLHMLITSILLHYHPDDVELWLVDYNKVEFAEYIANLPPHVRLIGLERGAEFTFSLLAKVNEECQRRMELFKGAGVSDIAEYKRRFGVRSLPRIILIIDEFHQMTQAIQSEPEYVLILENILSEYRKFGLSCVFSDQAISDGLRGLTEKGKKQIRTRIAMANDMSEIRETLSVDNSFYDDALRNKISRMDKGDVLFKRGIKDSAGETQIVIDRCRTVYVTREERTRSITSAKSRLDASYQKQDVLIVDGKGRRYCDADAILRFEAARGQASRTDIPIYVGTPADLKPCFCFSLQERLDSNIMVVGADTEMRASIVLYTISCFARAADREIFIFADRRDELYSRFREALAPLATDRSHIAETPEEICLHMNGLLERARNGTRPKTLLVWLGIESIGADLSMLPDKPNVRPGGKPASRNAVDDLMDEIDFLLADLDGSADSRAEDGHAAGAQPAEGSAYDAREDISELISRGSRFGVHSLVAFSSVKLLRQSRFVKPECFEHKIALSMSRDDWSNYLERVHYIADLDSISAVYYDGGSATHIFRPYLFQ